MLQPVRNAVETEGDNGQNGFTGKFVEDEGGVEAVEQLWREVFLCSLHYFVPCFRSDDTRMQTRAPEGRCLVSDSLVSTNAVDECM